MLKSMKCLMKGHAFVDSRSQPGTRVCVRCRARKNFEGLSSPSGDRESDAAGRAGITNG